jgi:citrate synthase
MTEPRTGLADLMSAPVLTVEPSITIAEAARAMTADRIGAVVVLHDGELAGILTERDVLSAMADPNGPSQTAADWMTAAPVVVSSSTDPTEALQVMHEGRFRHLPIVDDGELVGIVSLRDLLAIGRLEPVDHRGQLEAPKGLAGVIVADTDIGDVRGTRASTTTASTRRSTSPNTAHRGRVAADARPTGPCRTPTGVRQFAAEVRRCAPSPTARRALLPSRRRTATEPLDALRSCGSWSAPNWGSVPPRQRRPRNWRDTIASPAAVVPTVLMPLSTGWATIEEPVAPRPRPGPRGQLPLDDDRRGALRRARTPSVEQYLISTIDHGFNASTFTARVVTSTGADLGAASPARSGRSAAPCTAARRAARSTCSTRSVPDRRPIEVVRSKVEQGERIMGFGHRRLQDPRPAVARCSKTSRNGSAAPRAELAEPSRRPSSTSSTSSSRASSCTPTSSTTPAS